VGLGEISNGYFVIFVNNQLKSKKIYYLNAFEILLQIGQSLFPKCICSVLGQPNFEIYAQVTIIGKGNKRITNEIIKSRLLFLLPLEKSLN
jgi:hypothetical protein